MAYLSDQEKAAYIRSQYPSKRWEQRVLKMSPHQLHVVYMRLMNNDLTQN